MPIELNYESYINTHQTLHDKYASTLNILKALQTPQMKLSHHLIHKYTLIVPLNYRI